MRHALFDTNIYGRLAEDSNSEAIIKKILKSDLLIHNFELIRKEVRNTSKSKIFKKRQKLQMVLLGIYDKLTTSKIMEQNKRINTLAEEYFIEYRKNGGNVAKRPIINDFRIVACASIKNFYIVVSDDNRTLASSISRKSYDLVNFKNKLKTPNFISYKKLKEII